LWNEYCRLREDINGPLGIAVTVGWLAFGEAVEHLEVFFVKNYVLEVGDDARFRDRLGDDTGTALATPSNEDIGIGAVVLLGNLGDLFQNPGQRTKGHGVR
jgi:hypothetical protein